MGTFEYFDHAADVGIRVQAGTLPDLFITAGQALMSWMGPAPDGAATVLENIALEAEGIEELLIRWLQELLYLFHSRHAYWTRISAIQVADGRLAAEVQGVFWNSASAPGFQEIKAVTYHRLRIENLGGNWSATVILDI